MSALPDRAIPSVDSTVHRGRERLRERTILVAESHATIGAELVDQLRADGYRATLAHTTEHARALARAQPVRAIVLGALGAPRGALELLEEIRGLGAQTDGAPVWAEHLPAIVLGSDAGQLELLRAFEMGADDFLASPSYLELRARLGALLRRAEDRPDTRPLRVGPLAIDADARRVSVGVTPVALRRLEYELLVHLARRPNAVCTKQELLRAIWGHHAESGARTVDAHASRLRRKLHTAGAEGLVVNVWGVGYRLT